MREEAGAGTRPTCAGMHGPPAGLRSQLAIPTALPARVGLCRGTRRRRGRAQELSRRQAETISALNWCLGSRSQPRQVEAASQWQEREAVARLIAPVSCKPDTAPSQEEAAKTLLRGRVSYDTRDDYTTAVPYESGSVSLPEDVSNSKDVRELLDAEDRQLIEGWQESMMRSSRELDQLNNDYGEIVPFWDRKLQRNSKEYRQLIKKLDDLGLIAWTTEPMEFASIFFVAKKDNSQRLIIDARRANRRFKRPPHVDLITSEGLSRIEQYGEGDDDYRFTMGLGDVNNCFHRLKMPPGMHRCFALEPINSKYTPLKNELQTGTPVYPCLSSFPMGFSWSLWVAQRCGETLLSQVPGLGKPSIASDYSAPMIIGHRHPPRYYLYVDNFGVLGHDEKKVEALLENGCGWLTEQGLETHEQEIMPQGGEALGCMLDAGTRTTRMTTKRRWRMDGALRWALRRRRLSGKQLERLVGQATFISMLDRTGLSVFNACYAFIHKFGDDNGMVWPTVRNELQAFLGLLPLLESRWDLPWSEVVTATDASLDGWGCCQYNMDSDEVADMGRVPELARFRRTDAPGAPESAAAAIDALLEHDDLVNTVDTEAVLRSLPGCGGSDHWALDDGFPELPFGPEGRPSTQTQRSAAQCWKTVGKGRWSRKERILELEARALNMGLEAFIRAGHRDCRALFLTDNMAICLAYARGRCKNFTVLTLIRRARALCKLYNIRPYYRWLKSEFNPADAPSREHVGGAPAPPASTSASTRMPDVKIITNYETDEIRTLEAATGGAKPEQGLSTEAASDGDTSAPPRTPQAVPPADRRQCGHGCAAADHGESEAETGRRRPAHEEASATDDAEGLQAAAEHARPPARQRTRGGRRPGERRPGGRRDLLRQRRRPADQAESCPSPGKPTSRFGLEREPGNPVGGRGRHASRPLPVREVRRGAHQVEQALRHPAGPDRQARPRPVRIHDGPLPPWTSSSRWRETLRRDDACAAGDPAPRSPVAIITSAERVEEEVSGVQPAPPSPLRVGSDLPHPPRARQGPLGDDDPHGLPNVHAAEGAAGDASRSSAAAHQGHHTALECVDRSTGPGRPDQDRRDGRQPAPGHAKLQVDGRDLEAAHAGADRGAPVPRDVPRVVRQHHAECRAPGPPAGALPCSSDTAAPLTSA